jgi:hypothetical protein
MPRSSAVYKLKDEAYKKEPSKLADRIPGRCFSVPASFAILSRYISFHENGISVTDVNILVLVFLSSILGQISVFLFPELCLFRHLFILLKMYG